MDHAPTGGGAPIRLFESASMMWYLAEKHGKFMPTDVRTRTECLNWVMWQMAGQGPMTGNFVRAWRLCLRLVGSRATSLLSRCADAASLRYAPTRCRAPTRPGCALTAHPMRLLCAGVLGTANYARVNLGFVRRATLWCTPQTTRWRREAMELHGACPLYRRTPLLPLLPSPPTQRRPRPLRCVVRMCA